MQFNSIEFIFYFLPLYLAVYYIFPKKLRSTVMLAGSLLFYAFASSGNYWWVTVFALCTVLCYGAALTLQGRRKGILLAVYLFILALILAFAKLYQGGRYLPAGMSFYLFQLVAYLIDTYREKLQPERNIIHFSSQIAMFPKLLSGPLMAPAQLHKTNGEKDDQGIHDGIQLLILGLGLKVILANRLGGLWAQPAVAGYERISTPAAWMSLTAYTMQLYFDFYGYSLMVMGLGKLLGYDLPKNFDHPYAAKSVSEFYRRWHMTLGLWFREYVYIPLGGNRFGTLRTILNLAFVWLFTGLWHGVGGNYLIWAEFLFLLIVNERLWLGKWLKKSRVLCHVYLIFMILLSWIPFAIGDWHQMITYLGRLFGMGVYPVNPQDYLLWGKGYFGLLTAGVVLATPLPEKLWNRIRQTVLADILLVALFWIVIYCISTAAQDPFLYFRY